MAEPIITLTTDFGEDSPYVAAMKGVILSINPAARVIDLSHQIPPQDVRYANYFLAAAILYFPADCIHVVVVDPGVGTQRALLHVQVAEQHLLAPDNGCLTNVLHVLGERAIVRLLEERRFWRPVISSTFHGRDILAPVAAHLSQGADPNELGPEVTSWQRLELAEPKNYGDQVKGEVLFVDHFGNLITNIPGEWIERTPVGLRVGEQPCPEFRWVASYGAAPIGSLVVLTSSTGLVEIAVTNGNAAQRLSAVVGMAISIELGVVSERSKQ
jgi:S-adenosylmethionine hydrolase